MILQALVLVGAAAAAPEAGPTAPPVTLDQLRAALDRRQKAIQSLEVEYEFASEALGDLELVKRQMGIAFLTRERRAFAFSGSRRYYAREQVGPSAKGPGTPHSDPAREVAFNGLKLQQRVGNQVVIRHLVTLRSEATDGHWFTQDYLRATGLALPSAFGGSEDRRLERLPDTFETAAYQVEPAREVIDGESCVVVGSPGYDRIWLAEARGYALKRRDIWDPQATKALSVRLVGHDFREVTPGVWLPHTCWMDRCGHSKASPEHRGEPLLRYVLTVNRLSLNDVPDARFNLAVTPGTQVMEVSSGPPAADGSREVFSYTQPARPDQLDEVVTLTADRVSGPSESTGGVLGTLGRYWGVPVLVVAAALGLFVYRGRRTGVRPA
jgi:hypothetical protein